MLLDPPLRKLLRSNAATVIVSGVAIYFVLYLQVRSLYITMTYSDWSSVKADSSFSRKYPASVSGIV